MGRHFKRYVPTVDHYNIAKFLGWFVFKMPLKLLVALTSRWVE
jgi:hypothetical protein